MSDELLSHIIEIKTTLAGQDVKLDNLERAVLGGDQPGLTQKVEALEANKNWLWGAGAAVTALWSCAEFLFHHKR